MHPSISILIPAITFGSLLRADDSTMPSSPPLAKRIEKELTAHGHTRIDPYFWLREKENPEVLAHLQAESAYAKEWMSDTTELQETIFEEMKSRVKERDETPPYLDNDGYWYYHRFEEGKDYKLTCRKKGTLDAVEEIILDRNVLAKGHDYFNVGNWEVSPDGSIMAYALDTSGDRIHTVAFKNLNSGEMIRDELTGISSNIIWSADGKTLLYGEMEPETLRHYRIRRHEIGTAQSDDPIVYEEKDSTFGAWISLTQSEKFIQITLASTITTEIRILPANNPSAEPTVFEPRRRGHEYSVDHDGSHFYILSNDGAKNFKLLRTSEEDTSSGNWKEIIPDRNDVLLDDFDVFQSHLVLEERENGLTHIQIIEKTKLPQNDLVKGYRIPFNDPAYLTYSGHNPRLESTTLRFGYTSLTTPWSTFEINLDSKDQKLLKVQEIPGGFSSDQYVSARIFATAPDGTKVPISLVHRKDLDRSMPAPLYLTAYGAYGSSSDPTFSSSRLSLLDRGFIYAIAHVRGGEELGRSWYEDGRQLKKKNTFIDFISCASHLIEERVTTSEKLAIYGGSAGGLLIGTVINERPDLFKAAVADVPFVDVVTTMLDETIPLTTGEFDEWGNPKNKKFYDYILSYSPYDQVKKQDYPALLVMTGFNDTQVQYFEPAKWVAKLRHEKTDNNPLIFKIEMAVGHAGKSGRFESLRELAYSYAFILKVFGEQ